MRTEFHIRQETPTDHPTVFRLVEAAFRDEEYSDQREQFLVERLRKSDAFIPELSLVATLRDKIVGYILLTRLLIKDIDQQYDSLALAPVAVLPDYKHRGIGTELIRAAHQKARDLGYQSIVVLGHAEYYPRFGYQPASNYHINLPFEAPAENCMAIELVPGALSEVKGKVVYPDAFFN